VKVYLPFDWISSTHSDSDVIDDIPGSRSTQPPVSPSEVTALPDFGK
jgi:hypothetical protein